MDMTSIEDKPNERLISNAKSTALSEQMKLADIERVEKGNSRFYLLQTNKYSR